MNNLSWLIYLADVAGSASVITSIFATLGCFGGGAGVVIGALGKNTAPTVYSWEDAEEKIAAHKALYANLESLSKRAVIVGLIAATVAVFLPSKSTVYALAASEMGEQALKSETGSKAVQALNAWLDRQISESPTKEAGAANNRSGDTE